MSVVIKVEDLSKQYRLGLVNSSTVKEDLLRLKSRLLGKEDPTLKLGEVNDRTVISKSNYVWSLKDINFEINQGDVFGIVGKNGAGKSTLLKILSKVTSPTTGRILTKGRIASLLEVGTGFHPELTGRENIFLNGAIMGMKNSEIKRKLDEIIQFAGVEKYLDTPVKRYSSGMYVRLAFAVAAHLEPEILIIDEVLAVGDAEFQKKCLGKMKDVSGEGRTVIFVSHNLAAVRNLCNKGMFLKNGTVQHIGSVYDTLDAYQKLNFSNKLSAEFVKKEIQNKDIELLKASVKNSDGLIQSEFEINEEIFFEFEINCVNRIPGAYAYINILNKEDIILVESDSKDLLPNVFDSLTEGVNRFSLKLSSNILPIGDYRLYYCVSSRFSDSFEIDSPNEILEFTIIDTITERGVNRIAVTSQLLKWNKIC